MAKPKENEQTQSGYPFRDQQQFAAGCMPADPKEGNPNLPYFDGQSGTTSGSKKTRVGSNENKQ